MLSSESFYATRIDPPKGGSVILVTKTSDQAHVCMYVYIFVKVAVNTIVPRSPFILFLYLKTQTVTHIRKNAVEYLRQ